MQFAGINVVRGILLAMTAVVGVQAAGVQAAEAAVTVTRTSFGTTAAGKPVDLYTIKDTELEVHVITFGARIQGILAPGLTGKQADVVLGYNTLAAYEADKKTYFGAIVGRYGNRLAGGKFTLDGKQYQVPTNNNGNSLHGGTEGFDQKVWEAKEVKGGVEMTLVSPDGDMGFPGTLTTHVTYKVTGSSLYIEYALSSDKDTVVNLTNHAYFNLSGEGNGTIVDQVAQINAIDYVPVNENLIPNKGVQPVAGTPFDFQEPTAIGKRIREANEQLKIANGYDHTWVLKGFGIGPKLAARVVDPISGRVLTVLTTEPGVQFYTGNFLDGTLTGKGGKPYPMRSGFCLETQHYPDSPNQPTFPSTELKAGKTLKSTTVYAFSVQK